MKKYNLKYLLSVLVLIFLFGSFKAIAEVVDLKTAERAAEYHGEFIFEKDLKICDHELMYWPWGEPAVYVFTLIKESDYYPHDILLDNTLLLGEYLVSSGKEDEGLKIMSQADRYMTVFVGATTEMPSFIKAYAGLPEHIMELALMDTPPFEPYWIYGGPFHLFISSKSDRNMGSGTATEIHLNHTVIIEELEFEKIGTIPSSLEFEEWGPFINSYGYISEEKDDLLFDINSKAKEGKHLLKVKEYAYANWEGCTPAAVVNCFKFLQQRGRIKLLKGNTTRDLVSWAAICMRTNPKTGGTNPSRIASSASMLFKGLGYSSTCGQTKRKPAKSNLFLSQFADEINKKYPTELGGGQGIYSGHSTTGIGYWKSGSKVKLIVHDGWRSTPNQPVYTNYNGYRPNKTDYPESFDKFHPGKKNKYPEADVKFNVPESILLDTAKNQWVVEIKIKSKNKVRAIGYNYWIDYFDENGKKYLPRYKATARKDYFTGLTDTLKKPKYKPGKAVYTFFIIDNNGHRLKQKCTVELKEGDIVGTWKGSLLSLENGKRVNLKWFIFKDGTFKDNYDSPNNRGKWTLKGSSIKLKYTNKEVKGLVLTGTLNKDGNKIIGKWTYLTFSNKWVAEKISDTPKAVAEGFGSESYEVQESLPPLTNVLIKQE